MAKSLSGSTTNYIHYNPERTDYSVTEDELIRLQEAGKSIVKDVCLVSLSIGLPCLINGIHDTQKPFVLDLSLFMNYLLGILGLALAAIFGIQWHRSRLSVDAVVKTIKEKPKLKVTLADTVSPGELQVQAGADANDAQPRNVPAA